MLKPGEIVCDNFAGGGGASTGIARALGRPVDVAINHDAEAIALHRANHPESRHICQSIMSVDPREATGGRPVRLAWFSPDCKHFSKAKGAKPVEKRIRDLAWIVVHWAEFVRPDVIMLENVEEFRDWGPLRQDGRPCADSKGKTFKDWVTALRKRGYNQIEWRELRGCDYGAPTIRKRLFLIARRDGEPIRWPAPTHGPGRVPYRTAAEIIDWSIHCPSIFYTRDEVKRLGLRINRPLAEATLRRIARGVRRYVLDSAEPFLMPLHCANRGEQAAVAPFVAGVGGRMGQSPERPVTKPLQTVTAKADSVVVAPIICRQFGQSVGHRVDDPLGTTTAGGGGKSQLVAAWMAQHNTGVTGHDLQAPVSTLTGRGAQQNVVACNLLHLKGGGDRSGRQIDQPCPTVCAGGQHIGLVASFLQKYYGSGGQDQAAGEPLHTIRTKGLFGLVSVTIEGETWVITDIGMRMLTPRELYRAQGFPDSYIIDAEVDGRPLTKTAQVRMCGNSVCPDVAAALVRANLCGADAERNRVMAAAE